MRNYPLILLWLAVALYPIGDLASQDSTRLQLSDTLLADRSNGSQVWIDPYGVPTTSGSTSSVLYEEGDFNKGDISDPMLLLQGRVPGVQIYNRGQNPNVPSYYRVRGVTTYDAGIRPTIVIDGVTDSSLELIDPQDIESIRIEKEAAVTSFYGGRSSAGVIHITTKSADRPGFQISYQGQRAQAERILSMDLQGRDDFVSRGGDDYGSNTRWLDEISRCGSSDNHHLAAGYGSDLVQVRLSTNVRSVKGVLRESGFNEYNTRLGIRSQLAGGKLSIRLDAAVNNRTNDESFEEAVRQALTHNPTAPIYGDTVGALGPYFEILGLFDAFNPVSTIEQNTNQTKLVGSSLSSLVEYKLSKGLKVSIRGALQQLSNVNTQRYATTSLFRGNALSQMNRGLVRQRSAYSSFQLIEPSVSYRHDWSDKSIQLVAGYSYQAFKEEFCAHDITNLMSEEVSSYIVPECDESIMPSSDPYFLSHVRKGNATAIGFFSKMKYLVHKDFGIFGNLRIDGSSKLGVNKQWASFGGVGATYNLASILGMSRTDILKVRTSYGIAGSAPSEIGLSKELYTLVPQPNNTIIPIFTRNGNEDLTYEKTNEVNVGLTFGKQKMRIVADYYQRNSKGLIRETYNDLATTALVPQYRNAIDYSTSGLDIAVHLTSLDRLKLKWKTSLFGSLYRGSSVNQLFRSVRPGETSPPNSILYTHLLKEGGRFGDFYAPLVSQVLADGSLVYEDVNMDGDVVADPEKAGQPNSDFTIVGNGLPDLELGIAQELSYRNISAGFLIRGALGHSLHNVYRTVYQPNSMLNQVKNGPVPTPGQVLLSEVNYSSLSVESGDFITLDNVSLGYKIPVSVKSRTIVTQIRLTGQNLITFTNYSGFTPEPVLIDRGGSSNGAHRNSSDFSLASAGNDHIAQYLPSRRVVLTLRVDF